MDGSSGARGGGNTTWYGGFGGVAGVVVLEVRAGLVGLTEVKPGVDWVGFCMCLG